MTSYMGLQFTYFLDTSPYHVNKDFKEIIFVYNYDSQSRHDFTIADVKQGSLDVIVNPVDVDLKKDISPELRIRSSAGPQLDEKLKGTIPINTSIITDSYLLSTKVQSKK